MKGHKEAGCFQKFPKKALALYKEKTLTAKSATSIVEVSLVSLNSEKLGIDMSKLQDEGNDSLAILCQENVWICNMGASTHAYDVEQQGSKKHSRHDDVQSWAWRLGNGV